MLFLTSLKTQYENLGDQAIGAVMVARASQAVHMACLIDGVPADYLAEFKALVAQLGGRDVAYVGRGDALKLVARTLLAGRRVGLFFSPGDIRADRSAKTRQAIVAAARALGRFRFAQVGTSYASVGPENAQLFRVLAAAGHPVTVRDGTSRARLAAAGVTLPIVPDLAFGLPTNAHAGGRRAVFAFRETEGVSTDDLVARLARLVAQVRAAGLEPVLFWQVARDAALARTLAERLAIPNLNADDRRPTYAQAAAVYAGAAAMFSNRLHSLLVAAAQGALPFATLHPAEIKVRGVFDHAGLTHLVSSTPEEDADTFVRASADMDAQRTRVAEAFARERALLDGYFARVAG
jgi:polysaccharide pyruvyl transferase WcaK-like protein